MHHTTKLMGAGAGIDIEKSKRGRTEEVRIRKRSWLEQVLSDHGISGVIALVVIGTICLITVQQVMAKQPIEIPKYFTELSSLIVGYYFGAHAVKKRRDTNDDA